MSRVLLLDDDNAFRALVRPALERVGFRVHEAAKGRDGLQFLFEHRFDLLIVDGLLPDTNGPRWLEKIRAEGFATPAIFVSAFFRDSASYKRLREQLGCADVFYKPLDAAELAARARVVVPALRPTLPPPPPSESIDLFELDVGDLLDDDSDLRSLGHEIAALPEEAARELQVLERRFVAAMPGLLARTVDLLESVLRTPEDCQTAELAFVPVHELAGTAASFGFGAVGDAAKRLQHELFRLKKGAPADLSQLARDLDILRTESLSEAESTLDTVSAAPERDTRTRALQSNVLGPKLLVVDDDPALLEYVASCLADTTAIVLPYTVAALQAERLPEQLDGAILSLPLGGETSVTRGLIRELRDKHPNLPIAALSLQNEWDTRQVAHKSGADLFLSHPLDSRSLHRAVERLESLRVRPCRISILDTPGLLAELTKMPDMQARELHTAAELAESFETERPHVVVLGGKSSHDLLATLRACDGGDDVTVILHGLTAHPLADAQLPIGADRATFVAAQARRAVARRRRRADALPGVAQKTVALGSLRAGLAAAKRHGKNYTVAVLRVSGYEDVFAQEGAALAERVIASIAGLLASRFRMEDVRGRLDGGLLVAGFGESSAEQVLPALARLQEEASRLVFQGKHGHVHVSLAVGCASAPLHGSSLRDLLLHAEESIEVLAG